MFRISWNASSNCEFTPGQKQYNLWLYVCFLPFLWWDSWILFAISILSDSGTLTRLLLKRSWLSYAISSLNSQYDFTNRKQPFLVSGQLCNTIVSIVNRQAFWRVAAWDRFNISGVTVRDMMTCNSNNSSYDGFLCSFKYSLKECLLWVDLFQVCMWSLDHIFRGEELFYVHEKWGGNKYFWKVYTSGLSCFHQ